MTHIILRGILALLLSIVTLSGQPKDATALLNNVKSNFARIKDYRAALDVKLDVDFLKVPEIKAEILYKAPDKFKLNAEGFALLPKQGLQFSPLALLNASYTSFVEREEVFDGVTCKVVKVVPLGDTKEIILHTLWVDESAFIIRRIESTTRGNGTFSITLGYSPALLKKYPLPDEMNFEFDISKTNLPRGISPDSEPEKKSKKRNAITKGKVEIRYTNYRVNQGLSDDLFREKDTK